MRTSLALSLITGKAFRIDNVRAGRKNPGMQKQHLVCITSAAEIGAADVNGAAIGSRQFTFRPGPVTPGKYYFRIGTAGSTGLVMQTVLPPLMSRPGDSSVTIEGGTHNPWAPPYDFIEQTFIPLINSMGPVITADLHRLGFYPTGGGEVTYHIKSAELSPFHFDADEPINKITSRVCVVNLPRSIAEREAAVLLRRLPMLGTGANSIQIEEVSNCRGQGNYIAIHVNRGPIVETITAIGGKGIRAEEVADSAANETEKYLNNGAPVGEHLADQLLIPLALAGGGSYVTGELTEHTRTNITVIKKFLDVEIRSEDMGSNRTKIIVGS